MFQYIYSSIMGVPSEETEDETVTSGGERPTQRVVVVMDSSGSMEAMGKEPVQGVNAFIAEQKKATDAWVRVSLYEFNYAINRLVFDQPIEDVAEFPHDMFKPQGLTALRDGIHRAIRDIERLVDDRRHEAIDAPTIIVFTDGVENASRVSKAEIRELIRQKRELGWVFTFMGCNQDALDVGVSMGMQAEQCLTTSNDPMTQNSVWDAVAHNTTRTRSGNSQGFTEVERTASAPPRAYAADAREHV